MTLGKEVKVIKIDCKKMHTVTDNLFDGDAKMELRRSVQYGGNRTDFNTGNYRAFVILPVDSKIIPDRPWVWYAPAFIDGPPDERQAWIMECLLVAGFAIGGVDVGESFGSPDGRAGFTEFYIAAVDNFGLHP